MCHGYASQLHWVLAKSQEKVWREVLSEGGFGCQIVILARLSPNVKIPHLFLLNLKKFKIQKKPPNQKLKDKWKAPEPQSHCDNREVDRQHCCRLLGCLSNPAGSWFLGDAVFSDVNWDLSAASTGLHQLVVVFAKLLMSWSIWVPGLHTYVIDIQYVQGMLEGCSQCWQTSQHSKLQSQNCSSQKLPPLRKRASEALQIFKGLL